MEFCTAKKKKYHARQARNALNINIESRCKVRTCNTRFIALVR